jgi:hypothetical protein
VCCREIESAHLQSVGPVPIFSFVSQAGCLLSFHVYRGKLVKRQGGLAFLQMLARHEEHADNHLPGTFDFSLFDRLDFSPEHSISPSSIDLSSHLLLSIRRKGLHNTLFPSCLLFASTLGRLHCELVRLLCLLAHRETDRLFASSGVDLVQTNLDSSTTSALLFTPSSNIVWQHPRQVHKFTALRINLNIYGALIASHSHAYPSEAHSQTSQLLSSSLSFGIPSPSSPAPPSVCEAFRSSRFSF